MQVFNDSFNMFIGIKNTDFNWFDNPYIQINVYELTQEFKPVLSPDIKMRKCEYAD